MPFRRDQLIWLIPIFVGAVAYWRAEARYDIAEEGKISGRPADGWRAREGRLSTKEEVDAEMVKLRAEMREEENGAADELAAMGVDRLKEEILRLKQRIEEAERAKDWSRSHDLGRKWWRLGQELGERIGKEGWPWVIVTCPDVLPGFMEGWARKDPDEVLSHIEGARIPMPCKVGTLMDLLTRLSAGDPQSLKEAVARVPWELFAADRDPFVTDDYGIRPPIAETDDVRIWLESGVARQLAEDGVYIDNLFYKWAAEDLPDAIAGWSEWPAQERDAWVWELATMLEASSKTPEGMERLEGALSGLDESASEKIREALGRLRKLQPNRANDLNDKIPALKVMREPSAPPQ